jgi:hypothetical protein
MHATSWMSKGRSHAWRHVSCSGLSEPLVGAATCSRGDEGDVEAFGLGEWSLSVHPQFVV